MSGRFGVAELRRSLHVYRDVLEVHRSRIDRLNVYPIPDADTGTNMARTMDAVVAGVDGASRGMRGTCDAVTQAALMGARGNSGVILSQVLRGMGATLGIAPSPASPATMAAALRAGSSCADRAVLEPVEGTMLTVARTSAAAAQGAADDGSGLADVLRAARDAGRDALAQTPDLLPVLKEAGVVDAGGAGYLLLLDALLHVVADEPLPSLEPADSVSAPTTAAVVSADTERRYEVMFLCELADSHVDLLRRRWSELGDSITIAGGDGCWTCHVHTSDVGAAIETALDLGGRPRQIRVTDLLARG